MSKSKSKVTFSVIVGTIALTFAIMTGAQLQSSDAKSQAATSSRVTSAEAWVTGGVPTRPTPNPTKKPKPTKKPTKTPKPTKKPIPKPY